MGICHIQKPTIFAFEIKPMKLQKGHGLKK